MLEATELALETPVSEPVGLADPERLALMDVLKACRVANRCSRQSPNWPRTLYPHAGPIVVVLVHQYPVDRPVLPLAGVPGRGSACSVTGLDMIGGLPRQHLPSARRVLDLPGARTPWPYRWLGNCRSSRLPIGPIAVASALSISLVAIASSLSIIAMGRERRPAGLRQHGAELDLRMRERGPVFPDEHPPGENVVLLQA
mmetsp:Transcript_17043/g.41846  ORF Transcript_17043/g.41846 Transcript_17043/m.41846 type:complete len:200 (+) Transcript_17043:740-1339(+)